IFTPCSSPLGRSGGDYTICFSNKCLTCDIGSFTNWSLFLIFSGKRSCYSNASLKSLLEAATGQAAASPTGQSVFTSIFDWILHNRSISSSVPIPFSIRYNTFSIQPVPSRQGEHCPQLSWW